MKKMVSAVTAQLNRKTAQILTKKHKSQQIALVPGKLGLIVLTPNSDFCINDTHTHVAFACINLLFTQVAVVLAIGNISAGRHA